jgi:hypothetical protein
MTSLAQALPVVFIPEQTLIAAVRDNMIDHGRWRQPFPFQAIHAEGMFPKVKEPHEPPFSPIPSFGSTFSGM